MKLLQTVAASLLTVSCSAQYYAITPATGGVHPRMEIRELEKTGDMWNLFLLALTEFEAMDQSIIDSYYQISGIHGMPWQDWDNVPFSSVNGRPPERGYCPHGQSMFQTWHRVYMMFFEKKLQTIAINIAGRFTGAAKTRYQEAANKLRLPYWDWAQAIPEGGRVFPTALSNPTVQVTMPNNAVSQIDNPLYDYNFHPKEPTINGTGCWHFGSAALLCRDANSTIRNHYRQDYFNSNHTETERIMRFRLEMVRSNFYNSFAQYRPFEVVSNKGSCNEYNWLNFESVHDTIHENFGPGHMVPPAVAAFDPVFWLHHANVDRQLALWQKVYPTTYVEECPADGTTWTIKEGDVLNANSPLTPFHKTAAGAFWTSADVRNIQDLGYTYPELVGNPSNATLVAFIRSAYSDAPAAAQRVQPTSSNTTLDQVYLARVDIANIKRPHYVYLFLGDVSGSVESWREQSSYVNDVTTLQDPAANAKVYGVNVDLTKLVKEKIDAGETTASEAVEYLLEKLTWRIAMDGEEIPRSEIPNTKVNLLSTDVEKATSEDEFDRWVGGFNELGEVDA